MKAFFGGSNQGLCRSFRVRKAFERLGDRFFDLFIKLTPAVFENTCREARFFT